jgi:hypothetical protein
MHVFCVLERVCVFVCVQCILKTFECKGECKIGIVLRGQVRHLPVE